MGESDWDVEATPDDPMFTHVVAFSDYIAHERDDLVAQAVAFLNGLAGIDRAVHEDREVIRLVASATGTNEIARQFGSWWAEVRNAPPPWEEVLKQLGAAAHTVLKPAGFKKRKQTFNRQSSDDVWHVVEIRRIDDRTGRIDIGIYVEGVDAARGRPGERPSWISEVVCHIRDPLGGRHTFSLHDDPASVVELLATDILPALESLRTRSQLRSAGDDGRRKLGMHRPANVVVAALAAMDGDHDVAHRILQQTFEQANRRARPGIITAGERMGLERLTTGDDPTLTVLDEALLAEWAERQPDRLDQLQSIIDAHPVPARRRVGRPKSIDLSAGRRAVPALWRWLARRTPDWGTEGLTPMMPARYLGTTFDQLSDAHQALGELLVSVMFDVAGREISGLAWDYDMNGDLAMRGRQTRPILIRGQQIVSWLLDPPGSVTDPEGANMLESRIEWLIRELGAD